MAAMRICDFGKTNPTFANEINGRVRCMAVRRLGETKPAGLRQGCKGTARVFVLKPTIDVPAFFQNELLRISPMKSRQHLQ
jgi:hypothetical protein